MVSLSLFSTHHRNLILRRSKVEQQTALGQTLLPQTLNGLLKGATAGASAPDHGRKQAIYEILRIGANLCRDHGESVLFLVALCTRVSWDLSL